MGIEPTQPAWKAGALPLSYTRTPQRVYLSRFVKRLGLPWRLHRLYHGAEDGIRTRDFDLGKVALYH